LNCEEAARTRRGVTWATVVYLVQVPILVGYAAGWVPVHPIVVLLPLVGLLNGRVEGRGREGLGLNVVWPGRSLLLALLFAALAFAGDLIVLWLEGIPLRLPPSITAGALAGEFATDVFIIALWEEVVSRGYIQTRLQEAWGFWGVVVAALLFASLHLPSALLDHGHDLPAALLRFAQTGLAGLALGYVYWWTESVPTTVALHGLRNFASGLALHLGGVTAAWMYVSRPLFQLPWLAVQVALIPFLCRAVLPRAGTSRGTDLPVARAQPGARG